MLAVSPLVNPARDEHRSLPTAADFEDFTPEFSAAGEEDESSLDLLEGIDYFDDLFVDVLPELEMDPDMLCEYSGGGEANTSPETPEKGGDCGGGSEPGVSSNGGGSGRTVKTVRRGKNGKHKGRNKDTDKTDNSQVKKKPKVDWTPELHRKFVQAVEQLGVEKAVPSRILEIMNVQSLTRHNVASHLQKYRSHRKHLLAREAEAARWNLRRQATVSGGGKKPWTAPALGYPHVTHTPHTFRPSLHVWGHPTWPKPRLPPPPVASAAAAAPPSWPVSPATPVPSYWPHQPLYPQGYGIQNHSMYKSETSIGVPTAQLAPRTPPPFDIHPSSESIDAAIGDVMIKPWLPLPLGLKPPSIDGVMTELHRQGVSNIPPLPSP